MPRKKKEATQTPLVSTSEFEDAIKKVMNSPKSVVDAKMAEFQASNRTKRDSKKQERTQRNG